MVTPLFIKHDRNLDVCIRVLRVRDAGGGVEYRGEFWNLGGTGIAWRMGIPARWHRLTEKNVQGWNFFAGAPYDPCLRGGPWKPLPLELMRSYRRST